MNDREHSKAAIQDSPALTTAMGAALADAGLKLPENASLADLQQFESHLKTLPNQIFPEIRHHFSEGVYLREASLKAGSLVVGMLHKTRHFLVITRGRIQCKVDADMMDLVASDIVEVRPGMKLVMLALEDSTMIAVHVTDKTDLAAIQADVIEPEPQTVDGEAA